MKNVKTMKDLQVVLSTMDSNEFGTTGNFTVGEVENIFYSVSLNEDDKCYDIHVINFKLNKYQNYSYKRFSAVERFFSKKLDQLTAGLIFLKNILKSGILFKALPYNIV